MADTSDVRPDVASAATYLLCSAGGSIFVGNAMRAVSFVDPGVKLGSPASSRAPRASALRIENLWVADH